MAKKITITSWNLSKSIVPLQERTKLKHGTLNLVSGGGADYHYQPLTYDSPNPTIHQQSHIMAVSYVFITYASNSSHHMSSESEANTSNASNIKKEVWRDRRGCRETLSRDSMHACHYHYTCNSLYNTILASHLA